MTGYRRIGIFGATGRVGREITRALAESGFEVVPFSRQKTTIAGIPSQEVGHLGAFDVIVSTVGLEGKDAQLKLIRQAKDEGVKRFVASEYGVHPETDAGRSDFFAAKRAMRQLLQDAQFPDGWTSIASGFFDDILPMLVNANTQTSTLTIPGTGKTRYPFTVRHDIGRVLAETFKHPEKYKNEWLSVVNAWYSFNDIVQKIGEMSGKDWTVERAETTMKMPILHLAETNRWNILPLDASREDSPVELENFDEVIRDYVQGSVLARRGQNKTPPTVVLQDKPAEEGRLEWLGLICLILASWQVVLVFWFVAWYSYKSTNASLSFGFFFPVLYRYNLDFYRLD